MAAGARLALLAEILIYGTTHLVLAASGRKIADIYWNTTNPIFYFDNRYHIFNVRLMDKVDIICPKYERRVPIEKTEHSHIYLVDRKSYESCVLNTTSAKLVGVCMYPYKSQLITIVFRDFTPSPGGLEFRPNRTYYVISTSNGSITGLKNDRDGLCKHYNMRLQFVVKRRCRPRLEIANPNSLLDSGSPYHQEHLLDSEEFDECNRNSVEIIEEPPTWPKPPPYPRANGGISRVHRSDHLHGILWLIGLSIVLQRLILN